MPKWLKVLISSVINGLIAGLGAVMALWSNIGPDQGFEAVSQVSVAIAIVTGILTALKDMQAALMNTQE